jgi:hypothetical protein
MLEPAAVGDDGRVPRKLEPGVVVQVPLPTGRFAYGRASRDSSVWFYQHITDAPGQPPVGSRKFLFRIGLDEVDEELLAKWEEVGNDPFTSADEALPLPTSINDMRTAWPAGPPQTLESYLAESRDLAERLLRAPDDQSVYKIGIDLFHLGSRNGPEGKVADSISGSLHWIWGDLTNSVDAPNADPDLTRATERMRRAAREWLAVYDDPGARARYLDHWQYDECGDRRPRENER